MSRFDVVVPSYNYGRFLRECVESVLSQSHVDVRVLIIDDASQDDTRQVCAGLVAADSRVEVIRHPVNMGHIATYNEGIEWARGDYLLLLSADDFLLPGALSRAAMVMDDNPEVGLAPGRHLLSATATPPSVSAEEKAPTPLNTWAVIERLARGNFIGTPAAVVRTSLQKALGGYLPELPHAGDLEMWLRFALASAVSYVRTPQAIYRLHASNMSRGYDAKADFDQCVAAFRPHLDAIRGLAGCGPSLAIRVDEIFAERAAVVAGPGGAQPAARFSFFPILPPPPVGVILGGRSSQEPLVAAVRQALPRAEILSPAEGAGWAVLAANSRFEHFLAIDEGVSLTAEQIVGLIRRLEAQPERAHGLCGARLELRDGAVSAGTPIAGLDGPVSVLIGVLAFSKARARAARRLRGRLDAAGGADPAGDDDILISCAGAKPPICHAIGEVVAGPAFAAKLHDAERRGILGRLLSQGAVATFKPMSARKGPWGRQPPVRPGSALTPPARWAG